MESTFRPALVLMSGRALAFAVTFLVPVVLVRVFDPAEIGTYKQFFLIFSTLHYIVPFGMAVSLYYFLPGSSRPAGQYTMNSLLFLLTAGLASVVVLQAIGPEIADWMSNGDILRYLPLLGIFLIFMTASALVEVVMISRKRFLLASSTHAISELMRGTLMIFAAVLTGQLQWIFIAAALFAVIRFCGALFYLRYEFGNELRPNGHVFKTQLNYALPYGVSVLIAIIQSNFHQYAVAYSFDAATFAIYAVGCLQIPLIDFLATPAGDVMMVRMSEEIRAGRNENVRLIWHDTTRKLALAFFPLVCLLVISAREIILFLFTESYAASIPILMVWSANFLLTGFLVDGVLRVYARTRFLIVLHALNLLLVVIGIKSFLAAFGLVGAVLLTVVATMVAKGIALTRMRDLMGTTFAQLLPWRSLIAIAGMALVAGVPTLLLKSAFDFPVFAELMVTGLLYVMFYSVLLLKFDLLSSGEKRALARWLTDQVRSRKPLVQMGRRSGRHQEERSDQPVTHPGR